MNSNRNELANPLVFFQHIVERDGLKKLFDEFYNSTMAYFGNSVIYNAEKESFDAPAIDEDGEDICVTYTFEESLFETIKAEYYKAIIDLDKLLINLPKIEQKQKAETFRGILNHYIDESLNSVHIKKYDKIHKALVKLSNAIDGKYLGLAENNSEKKEMTDMATGKLPIATARQVVIAFDALLKHAKAETNSMQKANLIGFLLGKKMDAYRGLFSEFGKTDKQNLINDDKETLKPYFEKLKIAHLLE